MMYSIGRRSATRRVIGSINERTHPWMGLQSNDSIPPWVARIRLDFAKSLAFLSLRRRDENHRMLLHGIAPFVTSS